MHGEGKVLRACSMRHLTSDWVKGRGMLSTRRARSCAQYSNTRKMLRALQHGVGSRSVAAWIITLIALHAQHG